MDQKGVFCSIHWHEDDLETIFTNNSIEPTRENLDTFINSRSPRSLEDRSVEEGWEVLEMLVKMMQDDGLFNCSLSFKNENDVIVFSVGWNWLLEIGKEFNYTRSDFRKKQYTNENSLKIYNIAVTEGKIIKARKESINS